MQRAGSLAVGALLVVGIAPSAFAQPPAERGWVDVNIGVAVPDDGELIVGADHAIDAGTEHWGANYSFPNGLSWDVAGGVMLSRIIGAGIAFARAAHDEAALIGVRVPYPDEADLPGDGSIETDRTFQRTENALSLQAMGVILERKQIRVRAFGGPTYFRTTHELANEIRYSQVATADPPANTVSITGFEARDIEKNGWGFHVGGDVSYFFTRALGAGGFMRFSRASFDIENPLATTFGQNETLEVHAGGFQVGGGLRLRF